MTKDLNYGGVWNSAVASQPRPSSSEFQISANRYTKA